MTDTPSLADRVQALADEAEADRRYASKSGKPQWQHAERAATLTEAAEALRRMERADFIDAEARAKLIAIGQRADVQVTALQAEVARLRARLTVDDAMVERFLDAFDSTVGDSDACVRVSLEAALREAGE